MKQFGPALAGLCCLFLVACGGGGIDSSTGGGGGSMLAAPVNVVATFGDGRNTLSWDFASGATSYNLIWSTTAGVTKINGSRITGVTSPQSHTGLVNGITYFYVVTAVNAAGESAVSTEVSATPQDGPGSFDPFFDDQWHILNLGQEGGTAGEDLNVGPVWSMGLRGEGIRIAVVDDGLEIDHEDLATNIATGLSHNYLDDGTNPATGKHGTAAAGTIAARDFNDLGLRGIAPRANLVGYNVVQALTVSNEADAMTRDMVDVHVSNNSWGAPDDADLHAPTLLWRDAVIRGLNQGRHGLGILYVWAAGNGGEIGDNSNYDGYANYRGVVAVCAVDDDGNHAVYSEAGANLWVCAPSRSDVNVGHGISTTDNAGASGFNTTGAPNYADLGYSKLFTGTSAATPAVSGVVALMLQANPALGWRDVRLILARTARKNDPLHVDWFTNGAGHDINHVYGFGIVDAGAAVAAALGWSNVGAELTYQDLASPALAIPDNTPTGVSDTIVVGGSGLSNIEYVEVTFAASDHTFAGDLEITLTNDTTGTVSRLAELHDCPGFVCTPHDGWVFGTARHLDEAADGIWTLTVADRAAMDVGTFQSWGLKFYGR
jgi:kexin